MPDDGFVPTFLTELPLARDALGFARELHRGQRRSSDQAPFILHPLEVAALLHTTGYGEIAVAAGILHDTVEDTGVETETITDRFGTEVGALVGATTEDPRIEPYQERKAALRRQGDPEHPLVQKLRFELEALRALPPRSGRPGAGSPR
jgi:(p)ppGpp synthase/HD superfamily hydrolase